MLRIERNIVNVGAEKIITLYFCRNKFTLNYNFFCFIDADCGRSRSFRKMTKIFICIYAADFSLLNLPKGKSLGRSKPATNS